MEPDSRDPHANRHILRCEIVHCANSNAHTNRHILHALHFGRLHAARCQVLSKKKRKKWDEEFAVSRDNTLVVAQAFVFGIVLLPQHKHPSIQKLSSRLGCCFHSRCPCFRHGKQFSYGITFSLLLYLPFSGLWIVTFAGLLISKCIFRFSASFIVIGMPSVFCVSPTN